MDYASRGYCHARRGVAYGKMLGQTVTPLEYTESLDSIVSVAYMYSADPQTLINDMAK